MPSRLSGVDWNAVAMSLDERGFATIPGLVSPADCRDLVALYDDEAAFRSRVVMARHGFGQGEYKYLRYPLPPTVEGLRQAIYPRLAPVANRWRAALKETGTLPAALDDYLAQCHDAGQTRPTPLLLKYGAGDYNCLHQDLYGEFVLVEQRPRMQSRAEVVPLGQGEAVIFAVAHRPVAGARGDYRVALRHGVSRLRSGTRFTVGVIFHDAK
jgi:uncharacterized protein